MPRKLAILATALKLFNETNTQAVTTNHISKEMNISPGNLHYHYKNREEIIRILYLQLRDKMTLTKTEFPKTIKELSQHQKLLIELQWDYRFFFREMLFLFSRDEELKQIYIQENIAHRSRIKLVIEGLIENNELTINDEGSLEHMVESILMAWQFYTSHMQTLGRPLTKKSAQEAVTYSEFAMLPFRTKK